MNPSKIDPITFLVLRDGAYWREAQEASPIHADELVVTRIEPVASFPSSVLAQSRGVINERVAERPHGKPKHASY